MSWRHTRAAGEWADKRAPVKAVLNALAHHADPYTSRCFPSLERIILFTGLSRRSVQNALRVLEKEKLIVTRQGTGRYVSTYELRLPNCEPIEQNAAGRGAQEVRPRGARNDARGAGRAPVTSNNRQENGARSPAAALPSDWWPDEAMLAWADAEFETVDVKAETQLFKDNATKKGETYVDASAAWKVWIRRGETFAIRDKARETTGRRRSGAGNTRGADSLREAAARARKPGLQ